MREMNQKVLGAFVIGFSLVAGAYTWTNFGEPRSSYSLSNQEAAPIRTAIPVTDNDNNGIEDWRDVFATNEPVIIGEPSASYTPPTTVTGRLGINLFEDFVRAKNYGPFGRTQEQVVTDTVNELSRNTEQTLFGIKDVVLMTSWTDDDLRTYGNAMGNIILTNSLESPDDELTILNDIIANQKKERIAELQVIAGTYKTMRDQTIALPVPRPFLKEHLDLINTYEAVYQDINAMTLSLDDPAVALLRIRRYQDDALGLALSLENMYLNLEKHAELFSANDPALVFANFNSTNLVQQ